MAMLKDETETLKEIAHSLAPDRVPTDLFSAKFLEVLEDKILSECRKTQRSWVQLLGSPVKEDVIKRYIPYQQQCVLELADRIYTWTIDQYPALSIEVTEQIFTCKELLLRQLLSLNEFLLSYFFSYFNIDSKIPSASLPQAINIMAELARKLDLDLENSVIDVNLKRCIQAYLIEIQQFDDNVSLTYRIKNYLKSFVDLLSFILSHDNDRDMNARIYEASLYINFNYPGFLNWYQQSTMLRLQVAGNASDRLKLLLEEVIFVKTIPVHESASYEPNLLPINILIFNWLDEKIVNENGGQSLRRVEKMPLTITVAQLGLLIRLLYEEGIFNVLNITEILRFFSSYFSSKKQREISAESMRKSFYNKDQFNAAAVRHLLSKMLERINALFFSDKG